METDLTSFINDLYVIVCNLNEQNIALNSYGIFNRSTPNRFLGDTVNHTSFSKVELTVNATEFLNAVKILPFLVEKTTRKFLVGSYLKHVVEKHLRGGYISNGYVILAMLYLKYDMRLPKESPINCSFACKYIKSDASIKPASSNLLKF